MKIRILLLSSIICVLSTGVNAAMLTVNYTGYISNVLQGTSDSQLGLGLNDSFVGSITLDLDNLLGTFPQTDEFGNEEGYYNFSGVSNLGKVGGNSVTASSASIFTTADYVTETNEIVDTIGFGSFGQYGPWVPDGSYQYIAELGFLLDVISSDASLPDFTSLDPASSIWQDFYITENAFEAEGVLTAIDIQVSAVPVPAAVWLFASGLLGLVGFSRRSKA